MKRFICILFLCWVSGAGLFAKRDILVIYDGKESVSNGYVGYCYLRDMLGHFDVDRINVVNAGAYKQGMLKGIDFVFLILDEMSPTFSRMMINDLLGFKGDIVWGDRHVQEFLNQAHGRYGFKVGETVKRKDWIVFYKNEDLPKEDPALNIVTVTDPANVFVYSMARNKDDQTYPYFIRSKNLWYIADPPFSYADEGGRFLVLADLLHVLFNEKHLSSRNAMIRLEDVNPQSNPENLRTIVNYLYDENIPFQISLIPIYIDPANQVEVYLSERPEMIKAIKEAVSKGGSVVMHGITHQNRGTTGDDYEFWDDIAGKSIAFESKDWIKQKVVMGMEELFQDGIYPLAWETPHYSASQETYRVMAGFFDTFYDRVMALELTDTQLPMPYPSRYTHLGVNVVPENLGYIAIEAPDTKRILDNAQNVTVVRDGLVSFFFHPFVPLKYLKTIVEGLRDRGYTFISLKDFPCNVKTQSHWVTTSGGKGKITLSDQYLHEIHFDRKGRIKKETYSPDRKNGVISKEVNISGGSMYVMEAVDVLPVIKEKPGFFVRVKNWIKGLFASKKEAKSLTLLRTLVLISRSSAITTEENFDQQSFLSVLKIFGFNPDVRELGSKKKFSLNGYGLVVVPYGTARKLMEVETSSILDFVEKGGVLVTDGPSILAGKLGMRFTNRTVRVKEVKEVTLPVKKMAWNPPLNYHPFICDEFTLLNCTALTREPLSIVREFGKGKVLFFGPLFDPYTAYGISRFPYFPHYLKNTLGLSFNVRRNHLEFYFDPGLIQRQTVSKEKLVKRWKSSGVKIVYLAAWHFYKKYTFDYKYFIDLCHNYGIAVYAWFEFPYVTKDFWEDHAEWREINGGLTDTPSSWRYMINLENAEAREGVKTFMKKIIMDFDWDGVNLAELNYDTDHGVKNPSKFVPMNGDVRREFKKVSKFDPLLLFDSKSRFYWEKNEKALELFLEYRREIVKNWHLDFIEELEGLKSAKKNEMEVIVTVMDSVFHPEIVEECGVNSLDIVELMEKYAFTLQVEDPARSWSDSPQRYQEYLETYKGYVKNLSRLMFDINVVERRLPADKTLPTAYASGTELATTLYYAALPSGRAGIYAESTVNPFDMDILPFVLGSDVILIEDKENSFSIDSQRPFTLAMNESDYFPFIDGDAWPFFGFRGISIPSGKHRLTLEKIHTMDLHHLDASITFDGDMYDLSLMGDIYSLRYDSPTPVALSFNRPLERVLVDLRLLEIPVEKSSIILPRGEHTLEVFVESKSTRAINVIGYLSSTVFYILGIFSVSLLIGIYVYSRVKR